MALTSARVQSWRVTAAGLLSVDPPQDHEDPQSEGNGGLGLLGPLLRVAPSGAGFFGCCRLVGLGLAGHRERVRLVGRRPRVPKAVGALARAQVGLGRAHTRVLLAEA